jgi:hypothetical protein
MTGTITGGTIALGSGGAGGFSEDEGARMITGGVDWAAAGAAETQSAIARESARDDPWRGLAREGIVRTAACSRPRN